MIRLLPIFLLLAACSVQVEPQAQATKEAAQSTRVAETVATLMPQTSTPLPEPDRWNFLVLGLDKAYWRDADPKRVHSDFMFLVSVHRLEDTVTVTLVQLPRNVYVPVDGLPPDFLFGYYSMGGLPAVEKWVEDALGIEITASAATRMDSFIRLVDHIGGGGIGGKQMDGLE